MVHVFGDYEIDETLFEVRRSGVPLPVPPKVFDIVLFLIQNRDRVVTKSELLTRVWAGSAVTDDAINQTIRRARRIFFSHGRMNPTIQNLRGRGYRFMFWEAEE